MTDDKEHAVIENTVQLGEPVVHRGVALAPLFPRVQPRADYLTLDDAVPLGLVVTEVDAAGSVPELLVRNPLERNVLLYDGEELVGAKQNRILNVSVLVGAEHDVRIPVSCVEEGRWSTRSAAFAPASHAAYPELRRVKAERLSAAPMTLGAAQGDVWEAVADKSARHGVRSDTGAQADIFAARRDELAALRSAFALQPGQSGALLALGGGRMCLDYVSRPDAFARLYAKLLEGYLLDALETLDGEPASAAELERFVDAAAVAPRSRTPSPGLGDDVRLRGEGVVGSGLELDGEAIQLSAFSSDAVPPAARIASPARRR